MIFKGGIRVAQFHLDLHFKDRYGLQIFYTKNTCSGKDILNLSSENKLYSSQRWKVANLGIPQELKAKEICLNI